MKEILNLRIAPKGEKREDIYYITTAVPLSPDDFVHFNIVRYTNGKRRLIFPIDIQSVCLNADVPNLYWFSYMPKKFIETIKKLSGLNPEDEIALSSAAGKKLELLV